MIKKKAVNIYSYLLFRYCYVCVLLVVSYEDRFQVCFFSILIQQRKSYIEQMYNKKISIQEWSLLAHGKIESDDECG